jgi:NADPH:quinone reductase-like Zn-dependent oxidoreductase
MKAAVLSRYGPPHVVQINDVEKPVPNDNEVLIKVRAAALNPLDWRGMRGSPYIMRLVGGLRKPKDARLGFDVAGEIEAVGKNVTQFKPGDEVFGMCRGSFSEYACTSESSGAFSALAVKPPGATFEQAAAIPMAGLTALQGLRDKGQIQKGQKVLINGAAGGVGTFAVQIARCFGADVTGVCSARNVQMVQSLGADRVVDYTREDFTRSRERYDLLFDCAGNRSLSEYRLVLNPKGALVVVTGPDGYWFGPLVRFISALVMAPFASQRLVPFVAKAAKEDLTTMSDLTETGKVTPVIDKRYRFVEIADALRYLEQGHARGKVVIALE